MSSHSSCHLNVLRFKSHQVIFLILSCQLLFFLPVRPQSLEEISHQMLDDLGIPVYQGNRITLLPGGREKFDDMFACIRKAESYIHLEYFKFKDDSIGHALIDILAEKVRQGIQVRFVFDSYASRSFTDKVTFDPFLDSARAVGIDVREFDKVKFPYINHAYHRDHRKIVVVDGKYAYTGGMNVADYYIHGTKKVGEWRDMHIRVEGPSVAAFEHIFSVMWYAVSGEVLELDPRYQVSAESVGESPVAVVDRYPYEGSSQMRKTLARAIDAAQSDIQIVNPYPTNVRTVRRALKRALKRGVNVQIMVSTNCDNNITPDVIGLEMKKMARRGATVWYYDGGFHHTKVMTIDHRFCSIGTTNLDGRSLLYDYEVNAFIYDPSVTQDLEEIFYRDVTRNCQVYKSADWKKRFSLGHRIIGRLGSVVKTFF